MGHLSNISPQHMKLFYNLTFEILNSSFSPIKQFLELLNYWI